MSLISVFMVVYSVGVYVAAHPVAGWTTNVNPFCSFFWPVWDMTIIIKYLQLLINLYSREAITVFESIENLTKIVEGGYSNGIIMYDFSRTVFWPRLETGKLRN